MATVYGMLNGVEVELPHPDVPCAWCDNPNMDQEACPNAKDICIDCCGED